MFLRYNETMNKQRIATADDAMALVQSKIAQGLTPVMRGSRFYRHSFTVSQLGLYIFYLDERGTRGCCRPHNIERTFDFIDLGLPVPGSMAPIKVGPAPMKTGFAIVTTTTAETPTLLAAAEAAVAAMDRAGLGGPERDGLARAIAAERRVS